MICYLVRSIIVLFCLFSGALTLGAHLGGPVSHAGVQWQPSRWAKQWITEQTTFWWCQTKWQSCVKSGSSRCFCLKKLIDKNHRKPSFWVLVCFINCLAPNQVLPLPLLPCSTLSKWPWSCLQRGRCWVLELAAVCGATNSQHCLLLIENCCLAKSVKCLIKRYDEG